MRDELIPGVPFGICDGWPEPLADAEVTASEAGIALGSLFLADADWSALRPSVVFAIRIDEHPRTAGYTTRRPDGTETRTDFVGPTYPLIAPASALTGGNTFRIGSGSPTALRDCSLSGINRTSGGCCTTPT